MAACRGVCCSSLVELGGLTDADCLCCKLWRGTDPHASSHPRPTQTKQSSGVGGRLPSTFQRPPAKKSHLPCQHLHQQQAKSGRPTGTSRNIHCFASSTLPLPPIQGPLSNVARAVTSSPCLLLCGTALCHHNFLDLFSPSRYCCCSSHPCTSRYPVHHTKRSHETSLSV